jgi:hypothetical protein
VEGDGRANVVAISTVVESGRARTSAKHIVVPLVRSEGLGRFRHPTTAMIESRCGSAGHAAIALMALHCVSVHKLRTDDDVEEDLTM